MLVHSMLICHSGIFKLYYYKPFFEETIALAVYILQLMSYEK